MNHQGDCITLLELFIVPQMAQLNGFALTNNQSNLLCNHQKVNSAIHLGSICFEYRISAWFDLGQWLGY
jgi:hypothetical protein